MLSLHRATFSQLGYRYPVYYFCAQGPVEQSGWTEPHPQTALLLDINPGGGTFLLKGVATLPNGAPSQATRAPDSWRHFQSLSGKHSPGRISLDNYPDLVAALQQAVDRQRLLSPDLRIELPHRPTLFMLLCQNGASVSILESTLALGSDLEAVDAQGRPAWSYLDDVLDGKEAPALQALVDHQRLCWDLQQTQPGSLAPIDRRPRF